MIDSTSGSVQFIELTGLLKFSTYNISVAASTSVGIGPSESVTVSTDSDGEWWLTRYWFYLILQFSPAPSAAPVNVTGMNTSSTSLRISWLPPPVEDQNGIIIAYNVTYVTAGGSEMIDSTSGSVQFIELTEWAHVYELVCHSTCFAVG